MSACAERRARILALAEKRGYLAVEALAAELGVTPQTVRRDVNGLCDEGLLVRQHGGASLPPTIAQTSYPARRVERADAKARIAAALVERLPDEASLFLSLGTTVEAVAHALRARRDLRIVTNNPQVAGLLREAPGVEIVLVGGTVQRRNGGLVGARAVDAVREFRCDFWIGGIGAVDADGTLLDYDEAEVAVMRAMAACARRRVLVADAVKFGRSAVQRVGSVADLTLLVTDAPPPPAIAALARHNDVAVVVAG